MRREQVLFPALRYVAKRPWLARGLNPLLAPYNPFDPDRRSNPYPGYQLLRNEGPVMYHERLQGYIVSGYDEAEAVLRSPSVSVDRSGQLLTVRPYSQLDDDVMAFFSTWLISIDPPDHTRLRKLISRAFTPRSIELLEPGVANQTNELLDDLARRSADAALPASVDVMPTFADLLPIQVIGQLLGIPKSDWPWLKTISDEVVKFVDPLNGFDPSEMNRLVRELSTYFGDLAEQRRIEPGDDLFSRLIAIEEDGDRLTRNELISMLSLVMGAGHETTSSLIGNALLAIDAHPDARGLLLQRRDLDANAIEELLRFDSPVQVTQRTTLESIDVGGIRIPAGSDVTILLGAANRDPRRHDRAGDLVLDRHDPRPLSFGHGIHHCVGAALARMEGRVAVTSFVRRFPGYSVDRDEMRWKSTLTLRGPSSLPVFLD
ncbi:MAG: cytochrome P450 [Acidimicrobiales bacterium]